MKIKNLKYTILKLAHLESKGNMLFPNQVDGLRRLFNGESIIDTSDTGSGKTLLALASLLIALSKGKIGVYLVPTSALRDSISHRIEELIDRMFPNSRISVLSLDKFLTASNLKRYPTIIIATYEKFIAEYVKIRMLKGFYRKKWIGSVVVDEAHNLGDEKRGVMLELLLRIIKIEQKPQFVFLSATFPNTEDWARIFNLQRVTKNKMQKNATYKIRLVSPLDKFEVLKQDIKKEFTEKSGYIGIVFCASREQTERLRRSFERSSSAFKCVSIHAGYGFEKNRELLAQIEKWQNEEKNALVFSTTIIMAGLDLKKVSLIAFYDADAPFFTGSMLKQGAGRSREKICSVYFYFTNPYNVRKKIVFDEEGNFDGFALNHVSSYNDRVEAAKNERNKLSLMKYAVMLYLGNTSKPKHRIIQFLEEVDLVKGLSEKEKKQLLGEIAKDEMIFTSNGRLKLTTVGLQILNVSVQPNIVSLLTSEEFTSRPLVHKLWQFMKFQKREIKTRFGNYVLFLEELTKKDAEFKTTAKKYFAEGDIERVRKDVAWLASALKLLLRNPSPEEDKQLDIILQKARSYRTFRRGSLYTFGTEKKHNHMAEKILTILEKKSPIMLNELSEKLKCSTKLISNIVNKQLLPTNLVKK